MTLVGEALQKLEGNKVIILSQPAWETDELALLPLFPLAMLPAVCRPTCSDQNCRICAVLHPGPADRQFPPDWGGFRRDDVYAGKRVISPLLSCSSRGGLKLLSLPPQHQFLLHRLHLCLTGWFLPTLWSSCNSWREMHICGCFKLAPLCSKVTLVLWIITQINSGSSHAITQTTFVTKVTWILAYLNVFCFFLTTEYLFFMSELVVDQSSTMHSQHPWCFCLWTTTRVPPKK